MSYLEQSKPYGPSWNCSRCARYIERGEWFELQLKSVVCFHCVVKERDELQKKMTTLPRGEKRRNKMDENGIRKEEYSRELQEVWELQRKRVAKLEEIAEQRADGDDDVTLAVGPEARGEMQLLFDIAKALADFRLNWPKTYRDE